MFNSVRSTTTEGVTTGSVRLVVVLLFASLSQGCSYDAWFAISNSSAAPIVVSIAFSEESRTRTRFGRSFVVECPLPQRHDQPRSAPLSWLSRDKTAMPRKWKPHEWDQVDQSTCQASITVPPGHVVAFWTVLNYGIGGRDVSAWQFPDSLTVSTGRGRILHTGSAIHRGFVRRRGGLYVMLFSASRIETGEGAAE